MPRAKRTGGSHPQALIKKNYAFPQKTVKDINHYMKETDCTTETDFLKRSVRFVGDIIENGGVCFVQTPDGPMKLRF
jgi:hypothetical protein